jgi:hypothetical protein
MNLIRISYVGILLLWTFTVTAQVAPAPHKPIVPLSPEDLIKFLPSTPSGWKLTQSDGKNFFVGWLCSQVTREFQRPSATVTRPAATAEPPQTTRVRLTDTGYYPSFNGDFENFQVGKHGSAETLVIKGMPARKFILGRDHERLRLSIRGRFIIEIETSNQAANTAEAWLSVIDLQRMSAFPDTGSDQLPKPITISVVDELTPANNTSSKLYWNGPQINDSP